jgi:hypothetical protein
MSRRTSTLVAVAAALLACLAGSVAPAQARVGHPATGSAHAVTSAEWHRLHPLLCHTAGDHTLR